MKASIRINAGILLLLGLLGHEEETLGQQFQNLDFESAYVTGYPLGSGIPWSRAFPGWTLATNNVFVGYDTLSLGGAAITICDSNMPYVPPERVVLDGDFSAFLFGGEYGPAMMSQTGLVPAYARSLRMLVGTGWNPTLFSISLGGQTIAMKPLESFPNCTLYGGDISALAGQVQTLTLTAPTPPCPIVPPSFFLVDDIEFSPTGIPEPALAGLLLLYWLLILIWRKVGRHCAARRMPPAMSIYKPLQSCTKLYKAIQAKIFFRPIKSLLPTRLLCKARQASAKQRKAGQGTIALSQIQFLPSWRFVKAGNG